MSTAKTVAKKTVRKPAAKKPVAKTAPTTTLTVASAPPVRERKSTWASVLNEARQFPNEFRQVNIELTEGSARQVASDIRRSPFRAEDKRLANITAEERWDASHGPVGDAFNVWVKFVTE